MTESNYDVSGGEGYYKYGAPGTVYVNDNGTESLYVINWASPNREKNYH